MEKANWHTYQVLTKRSSLLVRYLRQRYGEAKAPPHIWLGVSVEDSQNTVRLKHLKAAQASIKFVSFEPLLASVRTGRPDGIDWAIVGGESGPKARPMDENGRWRFATIACATASPSSLSNGAASIQRRAGGF